MNKVQEAKSSVDTQLSVMKFLDKQMVQEETEEEKEFIDIGK
jgi:hypothetical protein